VTEEEMKLADILARARGEELAAVVAWLQKRKHELQADYRRRCRTVSHGNSDESRRKMAVTWQIFLAMDLIEDLKKRRHRPRKPKQQEAAS
jgi:hypothetical protein